jgi:glycosyltransferase involved in cell wall biosynthesis
MRIGMIGSRGVPAASGGVEHVVERLGAALVRRGHTVTVFSRSNYVTGPERTVAGMRRRVLPTIGTKHLDAIVHSSLSTMAALRGFDVLHYHGLGPGLLTPLPRALARRTAVVQTVHALDWQREKWAPVAKRMLRLGESLSTVAPHAVIVPSAALVEHFSSAHGTSPTLIPNPVESLDPRPAILIPARFGVEAEGYLLFVGRLTPEKQVDLLVRAFGRIETDLRLVIVGDSSYTDEYVADLRALAAADKRVVMTGAVHGEPLAELLTNAYAFVSPSSLEGSPSTVLEAISAGLPIVASAIAPHAELLAPADGAVQLHAVGSEESLVRSLRELMATRAQAKVRMERCRAKLLAGRSPEEVAEQTEKVYAQAVIRRLGR